MSNWRPSSPEQQATTPSIFTLIYALTGTHIALLPHPGRLQISPEAKGWDGRANDGPMECTNGLIIRGCEGKGWQPSWESPVEAVPLAPFISFLIFPRWCSFPLALYLTGHHIRTLYMYKRGGGCQRTACRAVRPSTLAVSMSAPLSSRRSTSCLSPAAHAAKKMHPSLKLTRRGLLLSVSSCLLVSLSCQRLNCSALLNGAEFERLSLAIAAPLTYTTELSPCTD